MKMSNLTTAALLVGGAILACQSAFGQAIANDLYFGFQNQAGGGTEDYIINLGKASGIVGKSTVVDLSSDFSISDFDAVLGSSTSMFGGVIGAASSTVNGGTGDVYATQLRSGVGIPSVAGSTAPGAVSRATDNGAYSDLGTLYSPASGAGGLDPNTTWENLVEPTFTAGSFYGITGVNPDSSVSASAILYEDLWESSSSSLSGTRPFAYLGYFTLDLTGANPKLTFTSTNVTASLSPPRVITVTKNGGTVTVVSGNALSTHSYQLQYTSSLSSPAWINVGSAVVAGATTVTNTDSSATATQRFYRVQAQ
jgi:hypothetical protein